MKPYLKSLLLIVLLNAFVSGQQAPHPLPHGTPPHSQTPVTAETIDQVGEDEVVRVTANLVSVPVSVVDHQGQYVVDLQEKDFRIFENGVEQSITHFSNVDQPFSAVLLMDTSGSTSAFLTQMKEAAKLFVEQLRSADTVKPVYFHGEIKALTSKSISDQGILGSAIDQMTPGPIDMGTRLYDAVDFALDSFRPMTGRKAVILFTDGENTWGKATMKSTLREAEESDVVIYTVQYGDLPTQRYLKELAEKTGGRRFLAPDSRTIRQAFSEVAQELRRQYVLGYPPNELAPRGEQRKIRVVVNRRKVAVRARRSYTMNSRGKSEN
jgi:Ca-activated chloride channel homolog